MFTIDSTRFLQTKFCDIKGKLAKEKKRDKIIRYEYNENHLVQKSYSQTDGNPDWIKFYAYNEISLIDSTLKKMVKQ